MYATKRSALKVYGILKAILRLTCDKIRLGTFSKIRSYVYVHVYSWMNIFKHSRIQKIILECKNSIFLYVLHNNVCKNGLLVPLICQDLVALDKSSIHIIPYNIILTC